MTVEDIKAMFSLRLKHFMDERGKTQTDIVKDLGFRRATVSDWVTGKKYPRMDKVEILARYFGITVNDLLLQSPVVKDTVYTIEEKQLIAKYRRLNADGKARVNNTIEFELFTLENSAEKDAKKLG